jgi:hypothetical protein
MVMSLRPAAAMAAIWLTAVAGVSATAWVAIDRAGRDITDTSVSALYPVPLVTPTPGSTPARTAAKGKPRATPKPIQTPSLTAIPFPWATPNPIATPTPTTTATPTTPATPATPATTTATPAATPVDQTINVTGGLVSVRCTGATIGPRIAQPDNDWRVHVDTTHAAQIVVTFQRGEEDSYTSTSVTAVCTNGTPAFTVTKG